MIWIPITEYRRLQPNTHKPSHTQQSCDLKHSRVQDNSTYLRLIGNLGSAVPFYIVFFIITKLIRKLNHTDSKFAIEFDSSISQLWVRRLR
jgi:hypothetical protein